MINTNHQLINGDSRNMSAIPNNSVQLVITSPPYWQLKDYGHKNQIGYYETYEEYINSLNLVWKECERVLDNECKLCINIGDQYARASYYGRYKVIPIRTEIIKFCETIGLDYMGAVIWQKVGTTNTTGGASIMGSYPYPRNGIFKLDYEFILIFKKQGKSKQKISKEIKELSKMTKEEWNTYFSGHWNFNGVKQEEHLAMFPPELPKRLIKMFSFIGDTVLDPFLGSGTTTYVAKKLNRNSIGYEINTEFIPIIKNKLKINETDFFQSKISFHKQELSNFNAQNEIQKLPYIFKDFINLKKEIDPKKQTYGSKIDKNTNIQEKYFNVKKVLSPTKLILDNGFKIKLLGISNDKETYQKAMEFLQKKISGQKVFIKYDDTQKYDDENNVYCYLYLKNKTFINIHLLKNKLVKLDNSIQFKYQEKFKKISKNEQ